MYDAVSHGGWKHYTRDGYGTMKWTDLRDKLFTKEEQARADVLVRLEHEGIITYEQVNQIIELSTDYPVIDTLLDEIAKQK